MKKNNFLKRIITSIVLFLIVILMIKYLYFSTYVLITFGVLSVIEFFHISKKIFKKNISFFLVNIFFILYILSFCYFFFFFSNFFQMKIILYLIIFGCVASDIGGFIFGKIFKGPKLTKISPKKTYSGSLGSIILTCLTISASVFFLTNNYSYKILVISILISISCQIGDLLFSLIKRKARVKDTGNFLPGHGGILDRLDGILLGVPVGLCLLILIS